ncbi:MAG: HesA/MoeB/ThiF family protein [Anaerovoracaceae bacterium]
MSRRYERNMKTLSPEENAKLRQFRVFVAGCGGLGGYVIEELGRLGIGYITAVDGDVFEESNLNRQLLCTMDSLGRGKADSARERMLEVNPDVTVTSIYTMINEDNCPELIRGHDLVIDALDNTGARIILEKGCEREGIPMVHGAIAGWYGQVSAVLPGDRTIQKLYPSDGEKGIETELGNPAFTPGVVASIEVAEGLKILLGRGNVLQNKLLTINLLDHEYECFDL